MGFAKPAVGSKFTAMAFFKRPEVWVLLLLSAVGIAWVLWSDGANDRVRNESPSKAEKEESATSEKPRFVIGERRVAREEDHFILTLKIVNDAASPLSEPLPLDDSTVKLVTDDGSTVASFYLPFAPPAVLDPEPGASAELRYYLPVSQAASALWLEIDGERLAVKEAVPSTESAAFVEKFPEGVEVAVNGLDWQP